MKDIADFYRWTAMFLVALVACQHFLLRYRKHYLLWQRLTVSEAVGMALVAFSYACYLEHPGPHSGQLAEKILVPKMACTWQVRL